MLARSGGAAATVAGAAAEANLAVEAAAATASAAAAGTGAAVTGVQRSADEDAAGSDASSGAGGAGGGAARDAAFAALGAVWGTASAEQFEGQLRSFALAATLGPDDRAAALACASTRERLRIARRGLREQYQLLTPLLLEQERRPQ